MTPANQRMQPTAAGLGGIMRTSRRRDLRAGR
jgi:hypothetical protein